MQLRIYEAIAPHYLTKVRDAESYDQIIDLVRIRDGKQKSNPDGTNVPRDTHISCQIRDLGKSGEGKT